MVQVWVWMFVALVAAGVVMTVVLRHERRQGAAPHAGLRAFVADFRSGWADLRAERVARKHPERADAVADHLAPDLVDTGLGEVFEWAEPDEAEPSRWYVRH